MLDCVVSPLSFLFRCNIFLNSSSLLNTLFGFWLDVSISEQPSESPSSAPSVLSPAPSSGPSISSAPSTRYAPSSSPTTSLPPSMSPSDVPTEAPLCPPPGEDPNDWVDCDNGYVRGTDELCVEACGDDCCDGYNSCTVYTTACIKKDGSCSGREACEYAGYYSSYGLRISGPSCVGSQSCRTIFEYNYGMGVVSLTNSCLCHEACYAYPGQDHCAGEDPTQLPGLPECGEDIMHVAGQSGSTCEVRFSR